MLFQNIFLSRKNKVYLDEFYMKHSISYKYLGSVLAADCTVKRYNYS